MVKRFRINWFQVRNKYFAGSRMNGKSPKIFFQTDILYKDIQNTVMIYDITLHKISSTGRDLNLFKVYLSSFGEFKPVSVYIFQTCKFSFTTFSTCTL